MSNVGALIAIGASHAMLAGLSYNIFHGHPAQGSWRMDPR
jgi:hypothetical protein